MNEQNRAINDALRGSVIRGVTFNANGGNKAMNDMIRNAASGRQVMTVSVEPQEQPTTPPAATEPTTPPTPPGNAGSGAYVPQARRAPNMNDLLRAAKYGKEHGTGGFYRITG